MADIQFRNSGDAFQHAIDTGRLSDTPDDPDYAGRYMYMYTDYEATPISRAHDAFKNSATRRYIFVPID